MKPHIFPIDLDNVDFARLVDRLDAYQSVLYPAESNQGMAIKSMSPDRVWAWLAADGAHACGCVCLARDPAGVAEIKRLYVDPCYRGYGIAAALLDVLEERARALRCPALYLETGVHQPEAIRLYERRGFIRADVFGSYARDPLSIYMTKRLGL